MTAHDQPGWASATRRTAAMAWQGLEYRFDLFATEFAEERRRLLVAGVLTQVAILSAFMAFLCLNVLILMLFWESHRVAAAIVLMVVYLAVAVATTIVVRRLVRNAAHPFAATLEELRKDRAALGKDDT